MYHKLIKAQFFAQKLIFEGKKALAFFGTHEALSSTKIRRESEKNLVQSPNPMIFLLRNFPEKPAVIR